MIRTGYLFMHNQATWVWFVFGRDNVKDGNGSIMTIEVPFDVPVWRRVLTRVVLGSVWVRKEP